MKECVSISQMTDRTETVATLAEAAGQGTLRVAASMAARPRRSAFPRKSRSSASKQNTVSMMILLCRVPRLFRETDVNCGCGAEIRQLLQSVSPRQSDCGYRCFLLARQWRLWILIQLERTGRLGK